MPSVLAFPEFWPWLLAIVIHFVGASHDVLRANKFIWVIWLMLRERGFHFDVQCTQQARIPMQMLISNHYSDDRPFRLMGFCSNRRLQVLFTHRLCMIIVTSCSQLHSHIAFQTLFQCDKMFVWRFCECQLNKISEYTKRGKCVENALTRKCVKRCRCHICDSL